MKVKASKWRRYGVMVKDTTDTLAGMHRIEIAPDHNGFIPCGEAVAFAYTSEQADRIAQAVNCHADLLEACKAMREWLGHQEVRFLICDGGRGNLGEQSAYHRTMEAARRAINEAEKVTL